ncbi:hypothetical protein E2C01_046924 [Portunus trituberculatus]|uniref:Uncharacterized protein n=1 Tax=Portunus trituberculatus TaxID=210409 RepID=A0A5B7FZU1_PORTR|nr:hypothetical protein [Portunus trituberculatus]
MCGARGGCGEGVWRRGGGGGGLGEAGVWSAVAPKAGRCFQGEGGRACPLGPPARGGTEGRDRGEEEGLLEKPRGGSSMRGLSQKTRGRSGELTAGTILRLTA